MRHEHTLTALWDHEVGRQGAAGQGPGVATGHRDGTAKEMTGWAQLPWEHTRPRQIMATGNLVTGNDGPQRAVDLVNHGGVVVGGGNDREIRAAVLAQRRPPFLR